MARRRPSAPMTMMISLTAGFTALSAGLLVIFSSFLLQAQGGGFSSSEEPYSYVPVRKVVYRSMSPSVVAAMTEAAATPYEPFEVCEGCRCCAAASSSSSNGNGSGCVDTSCCYAIDCNLPGKPFGTCAFTPQTCGCGAANNCTQPAS